MAGVSLLAFALACGVQRPAVGRLEDAGGLWATLEPALDSRCRGGTLDYENFWQMSVRCGIASVADVRGESGRVTVTAASVIEMGNNQWETHSVQRFSLEFVWEDGAWRCDDARSTGEQAQSAYMVWQAPKPSTEPCADFRRQCLCGGWPEGTLGAQ